MQDNLWDHLKAWVHRKESEKFTKDSSDNTAVRTVSEGSMTPSGLRNAGRIYELEINDTTWTKIENPLGELPNQNAISIQNRSGVEIKLQYDNTTVGYVGLTIDNKGERYYDKKETIPQYLKSVSGTVSVVIEEIS